MENLILKSIERIDLARASVLRMTLAHAFLRSAFYDRAMRNFLFFILAVSIYLPLALYFPLWVLAVGPLIWGLPHLISSLRMQHRAFSGFSLSEMPGRLSKTLAKKQVTLRTVMRFLGVIWFILTVIRINSDLLGNVFQVDNRHPGLFEGIFSIFTLGGLIWYYKLDTIQAFLAAILLLSLNTMIWYFPYATVGALVIAHNFIAFFYWIEAAPNRRERTSALASTIIFALIHAAVFLKIFDGLINLMPSPTSLSWSGLNIDSLGHFIAPWSSNISVWYRCVVLYAFGQAIHYFVWLKAIPDIHAPSKVPTSFKSAWVLLNRDIGNKIAMAAIVICLIPIFVAMLYHYTSALQLYFAVASYHGYMELAGLSSLVAQRTRSIFIGL